jgi:hypothetical protein
MSKTEHLAKQWKNGPEEAFRRLKNALESTTGRVELDARTRYALAFLLMEVVAAENGTMCKHGIAWGCIECEKRCEWCGDDTPEMPTRDGARVCENCAWQYDQDEEERRT